MSTKRQIIIELSEYELDLLMKALTHAEKQCKTFAKNCDNGYGKASSEMKKQEHLNRAEELRDLQSRFCDQFL
jgi:hypothetical protein